MFVGYSPSGPPDFQVAQYTSPPSRSRQQKQKAFPSASVIHCFQRHALRGEYGVCIKIKSTQIQSARIFQGHVSVANGTPISANCALMRLTSSAWGSLFWQVEVIFFSEVFSQKSPNTLACHQIPQKMHPGRWTWSLQITHLYRKENNLKPSTSMIQGWKTIKWCEKPPLNHPLSKMLSFRGWKTTWQIPGLQSTGLG